MKRPIGRTRAAVGAASALCLVAASRVYGQGAPAAPAPADASAPAEELVVLDPFIVTGDEDTGYRAQATLAGTRIRTDLKDVGSSISVVTQKFLQDTGSKRAEDLLVYTTGTEVAGQGGNFVGQGDGAVLTDTNRTSPVQNTRVRGLAEADSTRDFFLTDIPWDGYNVGRVDLQRGPNAILFGIGSPAGIVNTSLNIASFKTAYKVENQVGSYGTVRFSADFNQALLENELAVRVALLRDRTKYRQDPAYKDDDRVFGSVKWDPAFLNKGRARTSLRLNYEDGKIDRNDPRWTPPNDAITQWYSSVDGAPSMNKATYAAQTSNDQANAGDNTSPNKWLGAPGGRVYDGYITAFSNGLQGITYPSKIQAWPNTATPAPGSAVGNNVYKGIGTYDVWANRSNQPYSSIGAYKAKSLTDRSVFDFYTKLLEGPNKHEFNDFHALNAALSQTFFDDKLGFEFVYDKQHAMWGYENFISGDGASITVDIMNRLLDGGPNPNVGRPMVIAGGGSAGGYWQKRDRDTWRLTAFAELNFADLTGKDSWAAKIFGRNTFTGLLTSAKWDNENRSYARYYLEDSSPAIDKTAAVGQAARDTIFYVYLDGSAANRNSASGLNLQGITTPIVPFTNQKVVTWNNVDNYWAVADAQFHNNDLYSRDNKTYRTGVLSKKVTDSWAVVWQGYWLDGTIIPLYSYRYDKDEFTTAGDPPTTKGIMSTNGWTLTGKTPSVVKGPSKTYSLVTHLPRQWREKLPGNMDVSLFVNQSENFQPDASRRDVRGNMVPNPTGKTKEFGVGLSLLDDKLNIKVVRYKTTMKNATAQGVLGGNYLIGAVEAWGQQAAYKFKTGTAASHAWPASELYGLTTSGQPVLWRPAGALKGTSGAYTYTQAELDATYARMQASINDWYAKQVPADFQAAWALTDYATTSGQTNFGAPGLVVTSDAESKGTEFEITYAPIKGLDISVNAAKTSASRNNLAGTYVEWIEKRWADFQGPAGEMRLWGPEDDWSTDARVKGDATHGGETARGKYYRETIAGYNLWKALEGSDVPELRPWRFNAVANYSFQEGRLRGANVGGSVRWQDKNVTGFPVKQGANGYVYDVENPYFGKSDLLFDLWIGYEWNVTSRLKWRTQLNIRNLFADDELIPVTVQPLGTSGVTPAAYRIPEPRTWTLTNTLSF